MQDDTNPTSIVATPNPRQPSDERALVVDDGFDVRTATTGTQSPVLAADFHRHLFVLDVMMPPTSTRQTVSHVWDHGFTGDPRIVESYRSTLRKKVDHVHPPLIHTLRGVGYSLRLHARANPEGNR